MRRHAILAALLSAALLAGCGDDKADTGKTATAVAAAPPTDAIEIKNFLFDPDPATVKVGQKIAIANADDAPHTLTERGGSPSFDSGTIRGKRSGSVTFTTAGTFKYYCQFHATMSGTVTVTQ